MGSSQSYISAKNVPARRIGSTRQLPLLSADTRRMDRYYIQNWTISLLLGSRVLPWSSKRFFVKKKCNSSSVAESTPMLSWGIRLSTSCLISWSYRTFRSMKHIGALLTTEICVVLHFLQGRRDNMSIDPNSFACKSTAEQNKKIENQIWIMEYWNEMMKRFISLGTLQYLYTQWLLLLAPS